jgi:signal peptidase II
VRRDRRRHVVDELRLPLVDHQLADDADAATATRPSASWENRDVRRINAENSRKPAGPKLWFAVVAGLGVAADVATKAWAFSRLSDGRDINLAGGLLRLQLVINHGAAFGFGARYEPVLTVVAFAAVMLLGTWAVRAAGRAESLGAALAAAGAAGNLIDRLTRPPGGLHGGVVDWLHVSFYGPTFNLADIWLRAGVLIAVGGWLWAHRSQPSSRRLARELSP